MTKKGICYKKNINYNNEILLIDKNFDNFLQKYLDLVTKYKLPKVLLNTKLTPLGGNDFSRLVPYYFNKLIGKKLTCTGVRKIWATYNFNLKLLLPIKQIFLARQNEFRPLMDILQSQGHSLKTTLIKYHKNI